MRRVVHQEKKKERPTQTARNNQMSRRKRLIQDKENPPRLSGEQGLQGECDKVNWIKAVGGQERTLLCREHTASLASVFGGAPIFLTSRRRERMSRSMRNKRVNAASCEDGLGEFAVRKFWRAYRN